MLHFPQWKVILVFGVVLAGIIFALPNLFARSTMESMPGWVPHHQVNLGLDLQGGAHLLYQLDENEMIEDWLNKLRDEVRETLRKDRISYTDLTQNVAARTVSVRIRQATDFDKGYQDLRKLAQPVGGSFGLSGANNLDVSQNGDDGILRFTLNHFDQVRNFAGGLRRTFSQFPHLVGDDGKSCSGFTGAGRLNGGVQREQVCLVGNFSNRRHDL